MPEDQNNNQVNITVPKQEDKIDRYIKYAFQLGFPAVIAAFLLWFQFSIGAESITLLKSIDTKLTNIDTKLTFLFANKSSKPNN